MTRAGAAAGALLLVLGCAEPERPPNVLWIVWDTVRADHLSLYGYPEVTSPFLDQWAEDALVFDDCRSVASSTVPAHGSMFTGLYPSEHGADNRSRHLDERFTTVAELFQRAGHATYLYSANPNIQVRANFQQGFEVEEHPWDQKRRAAALAILRAKVAGDAATGLREILAKEDVDDVHLKACGALANDALVDFLAARDAERPYFAFVNYMEAHEPLVPERRYRERFLAPELVQESYERERTWRAGWQYCYGTRELEARDLELQRGVYDAALAELDELLRDLVGRLSAIGALENTIVVVTSDHGEHLGEHHLLGHRYSLYEGVLRVPLVLWAPGRVAPGRSSAPATNLDLFATLLALAGLGPAGAEPTRSLDLRALPALRKRFAEYPGDFPIYAQRKDELPPDFVPERWTRRLSALYLGAHKLIWSSDGRHELYAASDREEALDRAASDPAALERMLAELELVRRTLVPFSPPASSPARELGHELEEIGY